MAKRLCCLFNPYLRFRIKKVQIGKVFQFQVKFKNTLGTSKMFIGHSIKGKVFRDFKDNMILFFISL